MELLATLRNTLRGNASDAWALVGLFLWVFLTWCLHDKPGETNRGKRTGWFKAAFQAFIMIVVLGVIVGKLTT